MVGPGKGSIGHTLSPLGIMRAKGRAVVEKKKMKKKFQTHTGFKRIPVFYKYAKSITLPQLELFRMFELSISFS